VEWAIPRVLDIVAKNPVFVVTVDKRSAAGSLIAPLEDAGVNVLATDASMMAKAWGTFYDAVTETGRLRHLGQLELTEAIKAAVTRPLGDAMALDRRRPTSDITPLTSSVLALYGFLSAAPPKIPGRGRVVALG